MKLRGTEAQRRSIDRSEPVLRTEIDSERHLPGSESLKGGSEEAPGSPVEAPRNSRSAILPRVWWLSKVRQDLQIPGCREHVLPTGATA